MNVHSDWTGILNASILTCILLVNSVFYSLTSTKNFISLHVTWKTQVLYSPSFIFFCFASQLWISSLYSFTSHFSERIAELADINLYEYCALQHFKINVHKRLDLGISNATEVIFTFLSIRRLHPDTFFFKKTLSF